MNLTPHQFDPKIVTIKYLDMFQALELLHQPLVLRFTVHVLKLTRKQFNVFWDYLVNTGTRDGRRLRI